MSVNIQDTVEQIKIKEQLIKDLEHIQALLDWDQETGMPRNASKDRARQMGMVQDLLTPHLQDDVWGVWLKELGKSSEPDHQSWQRLLKRRYKENKVLPSDFMSRFVETTSLARDSWLKAREADDFKLFSPSLEKIVDLLKERCEYTGYKEEPYDALLDLYEPDMKASVLEPLFDSLQSELTPMLDEILAGQDNRTVLTGRSFSSEFQKKISLRVLKDMGYSLDSGRLDVSVHPFTTTLGSRDIRVTSAFIEDDLISGLSSTIHEGGHGLYEQNLPEKWHGTMVAEACSLGFHESQSRLWENIVGRSEAFSRYLSPLISASGGELFSTEDLYRDLNRVSRGLIRVDADEVSYNLHIILRFRLERMLINGDLKVSELPDLWNDELRRLLGVDNTSDRSGILQDIHWSCGDMGYFPTYTLGNLYSAQLWNKLRTDVPDVDSQIEKGNFSGILNWLVQNVHSRGALETSTELMTSVTGEPLKASYFVEYLKRKYIK
ncbi:MULTISPECIES: carboxypeptidase M32 [unclassified Oceanispirochaeta]|uniref:carboxypeptidase M32 n=1 Tax=unclassified Oceanispirochaeta TaxID=2635722 RepID=UPI000E09941E|nr:MULTISPECIES: carboxypeptidase M32 [unclassified Oceanispirochaeta]MBF9014218.1 carboxypeptidase M32 [Oceanispirochaeta sp. M2]NPD71104.1 carboxypeptidase M32 [Oceanispirochaeta sp. M1]RDG33500.1 carboxypeptidase M32 [Oceanispirochaeta sp. M1]